MSYTSDLNDPTVEEVCQVLKLEDYLPTFQREEFTFSDLLLLSDEDLACLKLPMGPRRRLMTYVSSCSSCLQLPGWWENVINNPLLFLVTWLGNSPQSFKNGRWIEECRSRWQRLQHFRTTCLLFIYAALILEFQQNWHRRHSHMWNVIFFSFPSLMLECTTGRRKHPCA